MNVSPLSSQSLPRWRAMSISTPRPATPRSAIGRIDAQLMPPPLVVSAERRSRACRRTRRGRARRTATTPGGNSALSSVARMPPGKLGPLPDSKSSWSHTISRLMPSRPGKTGSPCGWPIGHWSVKTWPSRTLADAPEHLGGVEVVQRADLVVGTPFPPVLRGVVAQQFPHRRDVGHVSSPLRERGHHAGDPAHRAPSPEAATRGQHIGRRDRRGGRAGPPSVIGSYGPGRFDEVAVTHHLGDR